MKPTLDELKEMLDCFCCENWGTKSGMRISSQICQMDDDDYENYFRLYKEMVCLM